MVGLGNQPTNFSERKKEALFKIPKPKKPLNKKNETEINYFIYTIKR